MPVQQDGTGRMPHAITRRRAVVHVGGADLVGRACCSVDGHLRRKNRGVTLSEGRGDMGRQHAPRPLSQPPPLGWACGTRNAGGRGDARSNPDRQRCARDTSEAALAPPAPRSSGAQACAAPAGCRRRPARPARRWRGKEVVAQRRAGPLNLAQAALRCIRIGLKSNIHRLQALLLAHEAVGDGPVGIVIVGGTWRRPQPRIPCDSSSCALSREHRPQRRRLPLLALHLRPVGCDARRRVRLLRLPRSHDFGRVTSDLRCQVVRRVVWQKREHWPPGRAVPALGAANEVRPDGAACATASLSDRCRRSAMSREQSKASSCGCSARVDCSMRQYDA